MLSIALGALAASQEVPLTQGIAASVRAGGDHWAVLVAGSNGYGNYRHQSDVCHAYQVVINAGMKPEQVIVMAVDDIANSPSNPFPGKIFNKPTAQGIPGVDVYEGCNIDYSGTKVTPANFAKVLTGDASAGGKVLQSTSSSRVFVNFVDHGGVGLIGFPNGQVMHATELINALTTMSNQKMYNELVFYLEACESGSMFEDLLPANISMYATTAANAKESSWGTYCSPDDKVNGVSIKSCLGDLYSVSWMEDSDTAISAGETLSEQFEAVKILTNKSHVMEYGDTGFKGEPISNFQGGTDKLLGRASLVEERPRPRNFASLPSPNAEFASAYSRFMEDDSEEAGLELIAGVQDRIASKKRFEKIAIAVTGRVATGMRPERINMACHYASHKAYISKCGGWTTGALRHSATLAELCSHTNGDERAIIAAVTEACAH
mmetsp:Transcript_43693/g.114836  ORF Transcript_43693/g.114836 Transcript_43693/m.114836 type:complete len:435 (-) Transcript_43693:292-1596(-)